MDYSNPRLTDLFNFNDITLDKDSCNSGNESGNKSNESENEEVPSKKNKTWRKIENDQRQNLNQK